MLARAYEDAAQPGEDWRFMWGWKMEARKTGIGNTLGLGLFTQELQKSSLHKHRAFHSKERRFPVQRCLVLFCRALKSLLHLSPEYHVH